jgi:intracellular sulfur oxidation DsrE/DsrF family protein
MKNFILLLTYFVFASSTFGQVGIPEHLQGKISYPALDFSTWVGVIKTHAEVLTYDPTLEYKVAVDVYGNQKDSTKIHGSLDEVARTFNLHLANGVPKEKLKMAVVIHGMAVYAILNEESYQERFKISNPNLVALEALNKAGIELIVCGQNLGFFNFSREQISPLVKVAYSAKTALVTLDQKGYSFLDVGLK